MLVVSVSQQRLRRSREGGNREKASNHNMARRTDFVSSTNCLLKPRMLWRRRTDSLGRMYTAMDARRHVLGFHGE